MILILRRFVVQIKVAFGGVEHVSQQPPRQPEQTGTSSALALPGIVFHITCFSLVELVM